MHKYIFGVTFLVLIGIVFSWSRLSSQPLLETNPEQLNTIALELKAVSSDPVDAAFYRTASKVRYNIDKQVYPPLGKGDSSPGVLFSALSSVFQQGQPQDTLTPEQRKAFLKRLSEWSPEFPQGYDPGWKHGVRVSDSKAEQITKATLAKLIVPLKQQARLLDNEEYCKLIDETKALKATFNRRFYGNNSSRPSEKEVTEAIRKSIALEIPLHRIDCDLNPEKRWHNVVKWRAEDYFSDPQAIELCKAIEANDLVQMQQLIDQGADVNATGKDGMTLLLWAMPDARLERFELLLKSGANPWVKTKTKFGVRGTLRPGPSALMCGTGSRWNSCFLEGKTVFDLAGSLELEYLRLIIDHCVTNKSIDTKVAGKCLRQALESRRYEKALILAQAGIKPATENKSIKSYSQTKELLSHGAAHLLIENPHHFNLDYESLLAIAEEQGADFDAAAKDICDWETALLKRSIERFFLSTKWKATNNRPNYPTMAREVEKFLANRKQQLASLDSEAENPTVESRLAKLTEKELADIELPEDSTATVFSLNFGEVGEPIFKVQANGSVELNQYFGLGSESMTGSITKDELKWLLHLAVRNTREIYVPKPNIHWQINPLDFLHVNINVASGPDTFIAPYPSALGHMRTAFDSENLISWVRFLALKIQCGGEAELEKIVETVNQKFAVLRPDLPLVRPQQISRVNTDQERMIVTFFRSFKTAPQITRRGSGKEDFENSTITYRKVGKDTLVTARTVQQAR